MTNRAKDNMLLTAEDCKLIIQAIDSWIERGLSSKIFSDVISAVTVKHEIDNPEKVKEEISKRFQESTKTYEQLKQESLERGRVVQAKIILLKDSLEVNDLIS